MCCKVSMKQVIVEELCMKLSDFFKQLDAKVFGSYIVLYNVCECVWRGIWNSQSVKSFVWSLIFFKAAWCKALWYLFCKTLHDTLHYLINLHERLLFSENISRMVALDGGYSLTLSCIMLRNGQTYFKSLAVWIPQDF